MDEYINIPENHPCKELDKYKLNTLESICRLVLKEFGENWHEAKSIKALRAYFKEG